MPFCTVTASPVLLIDGWCSDHRHMAPQAEYFAPGPWRGVGGSARARPQRHPLAVGLGGPHERHGGRGVGPTLD